MILYISSFYPSNKEKFRGHYVEKQAKLLSKKTNEELIVFKPIFSIRYIRPKIAYEVVNNTPVYSFYFPNLFRAHTIFQTTKIAFKYFEKEINSILENKNIELVISNNHDVTLKFGNILSNTYKSKHFTIIHGETITTGTSAHIKRNTRVELEKTDCVFAVSTIIKKYLNDVIGYNGEIIINPNGLDQSLIKKYSEFSFSKNDILTIASVGNLQYNKGFDIVLDALKEISVPYKYYMVGDGNYKKSLIQTVYRLGLEDSVEFTGNVPNEDVYNILEKSHFFILPSRREAFGIVYLEGMITGNICIGTKGQGPEDIIKNGENGFLVSDAREISEIVLNYPSIKKSGLVENSFNTAMKYTWERNVGTIIEVYSENI